MSGLLRMVQKALGCNGHLTKIVYDRFCRALPGTIHDKAKQEGSVSVLPAAARFYGDEGRLLTHCDRSVGEMPQLLNAKPTMAEPRLDLPIDDGLEDPTNVFAGILPTGNAWVGHALYTTWFSHGATFGTVVGGAQFK